MSFSRQLFGAVGAIWIMSLPVRAHDFWVDYEVDTWSPGQVVSLFIAGGHRYPQSELLLADRLIERFALRTPDGVWADLERTKDDERWRADVVVEQAGWYIAELIVRRPRATTPSIVGRALFHLGDTDGPPPDLLKAEGLEIVPSRIEGDTVLQTFRDGALVSSGLVLYNADGGVFRLRTNAREPLTLHVSGGKWLIVATSGAQSATLVMDIHDYE